MSDDEKKPPREGVRSLVEGGVAGAAGLAAAFVGGPAAGVAVTVGTRALFGLLRDHVRERSEKRCNELLAEVAARLEQTYGPGLDGLAQLGETAQEAMYQALRTALDAVDDSVIPALGSLTAEYVERPMDPFFRGTSRVLQELLRSEFLELHGFITRVLREVPAAANVFSVQVVGFGPAAGGRDLGREDGAWSFTVQWATREEGSERVTMHKREWLTPAPTWRRLFHLLKLNGLAEDFPAGDVEGGPQSLTMLRSVARRLEAHLAAEPIAVVDDDARPERGEE